LRRQALELGEIERIGRRFHWKAGEPASGVKRLDGWRDCMHDQEPRRNSAQMRRSSFRSGPGWLIGNGGSIFVHCMSLNQNKFTPHGLVPGSFDQPLESQHS